MTFSRQPGSPGPACPLFLLSLSVWLDSAFFLHFCLGLSFWIFVALGLEGSWFQPV